MSILVVGMSHRSAPVDVLERVTLAGDDVDKLVRRAVETPHVGEAVVISTCNRVEVYVDAERFHGGVEDISSLLVDHAGIGRDAVLRHLYVHYDDAAVQHLFSVASGLDSMVVGESQILGQVRVALQRGQEQTTVGPALNVLFQQALRVGKRGHAETGIDQAAPSVVSAALDTAEACGTDLQTSRVLVVGAGAMAGLTAATLARRDVHDIVVTGRTLARSQRVAEGVQGTAVPWDELDAELALADVVVSCTGATGTVLDLERVRRVADGRPLVLLDLALPRDVDPAAADLPGVTLVSLAELAASTPDESTAADVTRVRDIVAREVASFLAARNAARVTPTVVALRSMATDVVEAELERLAARRPELAADVRADVAQTVRRVADKLLHAPTVRIKELAGQPDGITYASAVADLFALDLASVEAVTEAVAPRPEDGGGR
ncbi:MAG: glutamyl-tRNA reductase [Nocardioidaceae bacterium]|nr:glutamyl-tRNA reductase [Nocardioidaceae bacterium]